MAIHKDLSKPSSIYVCVSTCYAFLELLCLFANKPCLSMVRRNNVPGYEESRQKVDLGFGVFLVLLFVRVFVGFFKKCISRYSKSQLTSGNGRPKDHKS